MRILLICLFLTGCATGYTKAGFWGEGFSDSQLSSDTFSVSFTGNSDTSDAQARDFMLLRCAEIATAHKAPFFRLVGSADESKDGGAIVASGNAAFFAPMHFPSKSATIQLRADKQGPQDFDAAIITSSVHAKYGLK